MNIVEYLTIVNQEKVDFRLSKWGDQTIVFSDCQENSYVVAIFLRGRLVREYYVGLKPFSNEQSVLYTLGAIIKE